MRNLAIRTWLVIGFSLLLNPAFAGDVQPAKDKSLFERVIELNRVQEPELDADAAKKAFDAIVARAKEALNGTNTPREKIAALNKVLLGDRKVAYLSNKYWRDATLAACLLRTHGNCLSTTTLYTVVGEALKLPIHAVVIPHHAFARWDDGTTKVNIETTSGGRELTDSYYLNQSEATPADVEALRWGTSLDNDSFISELTSIAAFHRCSENKLEEALDLLDRAQKLSPWRRDLELARLKLMADVTSRRTEARQQIVAMLGSNPPPPPSVSTGALMFLASDAAGSGDHDKERMFLLNAFAQAPKSDIGPVLQQLSFCHRALKDYRGAVRYMELAATLIKPGDPEAASILYNLAILQKNDKRLGDALKSIRLALKINPESWNLQMIEAGYMVLNNEREAGLKKFAAIERPRGDVEFFNIMTAWFDAVSKQREKFYADFEKALSQSRSTDILEWIDQDVDLDVYRNEPEFKALVEKHAPRLRGK
jgi:tetratricopeptide (TPR) repeat protein